MALDCKSDSFLQGEEKTPRVQVTATGADDVYRLLWLLSNAQVEFQSVARPGWLALFRVLGAAWFEDLDRRLTGGKAARYFVDLAAREA